jgi:hypothetical protein
MKAPLVAPRARGVAAGIAVADRVGAKAKAAAANPIIKFRFMFLPPDRTIAMRKKVRMGIEVPGLKPDARGQMSTKAITTPITTSVFTPAIAMPRKTSAMTFSRWNLIRALSIALPFIRSAFITQEMLVRSEEKSILRFWFQCSGLTVY